MPAPGPESQPAARSGPVVGGCHAESGSLGAGRRGNAGLPGSTYAQPSCGSGLPVSDLLGRKPGSGKPADLAGQHGLAQIGSSANE